MLVNLCDRAHCPRIGPSCMRVPAGGAKVWTLSMVFLNVLFVQTFAPPAHLCNRGEFLDIEDALGDPAQCPNIRPFKNWLFLKESK